VEPYRLVSWWNMERFSAVDFFEFSAQLDILSHSILDDIKYGDNAKFTPETRTIYVPVLEKIEASCRNLGLQTSTKAAKYVIRLMNDPETIFNRMGSAVENLTNNIRWEMQDILFWQMPSDRAKFFDQKELFGKDVNAKFPTIQFDMVEAGNCYACGRGTSCVFHLMRIMEVGVQQFGNRLGVTFTDQKNWQNILDEINKAIKPLPAKDPLTIAMSQASANLYSVKLAWRNEVMHPNDIYTLEEADNLIRQVKIFMVQLASIV
jgi:hypothetical protein